MTLVDADSRANARLQKLRFFPLALVGGAGCRVRDERGRWLLDLSAAWGAASLGYAHPAHVAAIEKAARDPAGASVLSAANRPATALAERLLALTPGAGDRRVYLGHSGSDANDAVARAVKAATGRPRILSFVGAYHGGVGASMAVSGHTAQGHAAKDPGLSLIPYPDPYRGGPGAATASLAAFDALLEGLPPESFAACFFEPIQADGGLIVPPPGFLAALADRCARHGILTVCDEVKVGVGRSGLLHAFAHEALVPDVLTLGKGLGSGLPLSAAVGPARILDHASAFAMQTLQGNPICASAGLAVLETIERDGLAANAARVGARLIERLAALGRRHASIGDVRGRGLAIGVELVDPATGAPAARSAAKVVFRAFELGAVLYYVGMASNVLELTPPLILSDAEADEAVAILDTAIGDVAAGRVDDEALTGFEGW